MQGVDVGALSIWTMEADADRKGQERTSAFSGVRSGEQRGSHGMFVCEEGEMKARARRAAARISAL